MGAGDGQPLKPAQIIGTATGLVNATDCPSAAVNGVVRAVLIDPGTKTGRAKFESHYDSTAPLLRLRLTLAPLFELDYVAVQ